MLQGLEWEKMNFRLIIIVGGDSEMPITRASKLKCGTESAKMSTSWSLESRVESLRTLLINGIMVQFSQVRQNGNKTVDYLANLGVYTCRYVRDKD